VLLVLFKLENDRYALDAGQVVEVLPFVSLKKVPQALPEVGGVLNYHGDLVPVIDLCKLVLGKPASPRLSTRIILMKYRIKDKDRVLGLIAEQATGTIHRELGDFVSSGIAVDETPYLGPVINDSLGLIQVIDIAKLLPARVRDVLFRLPVEQAQ